MVRGDGDTVYLGVSQSIHVIDLQRGGPRKIAEVTLDRKPERLAAAGDSLYVAAGESGVIVIDVARESGGTVERQRISPDDEVLNLVLVQ